MAEVDEQTNEKANEEVAKDSENLEKTEHEILKENNKINIKIENDEIQFTLTTIGVSLCKYTKAYKYEEITSALELSNCKDLKEVFKSLIESAYDVKKENKQILVNGKELTLDEIQLNDKEVIQLLVNEVSDLREKNAKLESDVNDLKNQMYEFERTSRYKEEINLVYESKEFGKYNIFGEKFVENNKNNIELNINGKYSELKKDYELKEGNNTIKIKIKNRITSLDYMFYGCDKLKDINELQYLNTKYCNGFSYMFHGCKALTDIKALEYWNVSRANTFTRMFYRCSSLSDIKALEKWNVSKNQDFSFMFYGCSSITNIKALENWDVSNGTNFSNMFFGCKALTDIKPIELWNVSNGKDFSLMFCGCKSLPDLKVIDSWKLEKSLLENIVERNKLE